MVENGWLAIILAIVSIVLTWYSIEKRRQSFGYKEVLNYLMFDSEARARFKRKDVKNVRRLYIKFINGGNEDISGDDFRKPITLTFNSQAKVLEMSAWERTSECIQLKFSRKAENIIEITPNLIEPKEWFVAKFFVEEFENYTIDARIKGIKKIKNYKFPEFLYILLISISFFTVGLLIPTVLIYPNTFYSKILILALVSITILAFKFLKDYSDQIFQKR